MFVNIVIITMFVVLLALMLLKDYSNSMIDAETLRCPPDHFRLEGMNKCHPYLTCKDMNNIKIVLHLGAGAVKNVFLVSWNNYSLAMSAPANKYHLEDFLSGVEVLKLLNPNKHIVQFLGYCEEKYSLFTEFHPKGNAAEFFDNLQAQKISSVQSLNFCHQYANILKHLHFGPAGRRVFCDSNSLQKLLSQLLISKDLTLVLNDVDAVPEVMNESGIKCGHRQIVGKFVAPEQLWTSKSNFIEDLMPGYDEKTDIWKAAAVCEYFLKLSRGGQVLRYRLFDLHAKCKHYNSTMRPTSKELEKEYRRVLIDFEDRSEL